MVQKVESWGNSETEGDYGNDPDYDPGYGGLDEACTSGGGKKWIRFLNTRKLNQQHL